MPSLKPNPKPPSELREILALSKAERGAASYLATLPYPGAVEVHSIYKGEGALPWSEPVQPAAAPPAFPARKPITYDHWRVRITRDGRPTMQTDYHTGVGLRLYATRTAIKACQHLHKHTPPAAPTHQQFMLLGDPARDWHTETITTVDGTPHRVLCAHIVPVPTAASVLNTLLLDAEAYDMPFHEWCANYEYDEDSRSALRIYDECVKTARELYSILTRSEAQHLRELLSDY